MRALAAVRRPGWFLVTFAAATGVLLAAWQAVSGYYLAALVWATNQALAASGDPLALRLPVASTEVTYPVMAGAVALFAVTPGRTLAWRLCWLAGLMAGLFVLHGILLYGDLRAALAAGATASVPPVPHSGLAHLLRANLTLAAVALTWLVAVHRRSAREP